MSRIRPLLLALLALVALSACQPRAGSTAGPADANAAAGDSLMFREVSPQLTDPAIDGWTEPHLMGLDSAAAKQGQLFVFFAGSYGRPQNQRLILEQAARSGYHVIGLRYPNSWTVNDLCAPTRDPECFGAVRREILDGEERSPLVAVTPANSIHNRLAKLLAYLDRVYPDEGWGQFLDGAGKPNWPLISAGGHSQGGGHAAMLGKEVPLARVCMLSAPHDAIVRAGSLTVAPWLSEPGRTPPHAYFGLAHEQEQGYAMIMAVWATLGLADAATPLLVDDAGPGYGGAQALRTGLEPARRSQSHGSTAVDRNTPLLSNGTPALAPAWQYLCFPDL